MKKHSISISGSNTWMATVRLAADKATLDASWTNYFTECKSKGRAYFKSKIKSVGKRGARPGQLPPPRWRRPCKCYNNACVQVCTCMCTSASAMSYCCNADTYKISYAYQRNRTMGPVGRVPSNFGDHGDQVYLVPSNFCSWLSFIAGHCGKLASPESLAEFNGKRKEE